MSILFASDEGWVVSHLDYLNKIYDFVEDRDDNFKTLEFNENLFKINTQFLRQNQIDSAGNGNNKKKRKLTNTLPDEILRRNNYVKETSEKMLDDAKHMKLFENVAADNNRQSRLESKNFYAESSESSSSYHGSNQKDVAIIAEFQNDKYVFPKHCCFYCYDVRDIEKHLEASNQYDFVVLDPPWWNKSIRRKKSKFEESSYKMMYNEEIAKIPVANLLSTNGVVAVWCTNSTSQINYILEEMFPAWNVVFRTKWYWLKITQSGMPICDFNETHGKQPYEQLIIGSVASNDPLSIPDKKVITSIPSAVHSHKPPLIEIFKNYLPEQPKCMEIFARYLLPGWTSWGLEVLKFQNLSLYSVKNKFKDDYANR